MRNEKWSKSIQARIIQNKAKLLEEFHKMPILQIALERAGVKSRSTYYEWREKDKEFAQQADQAIAEGEALITDMSESQLISMIREKHFPAVQLWLRQHHPNYTTKIDVTAHVKRDAMTPEENAAFQAAVDRALANAPYLAGKSPPESVGSEEAESDSDKQNKLTNNNENGQQSK